MLRRRSIPTTDSLFDRARTEACELFWSSDIVLLCETLDGLNYETSFRQMACSDQAQRASYSETFIRWDPPARQWATEMETLNDSGQTPMANEAVQSNFAS